MTKEFTLPAEMSLSSERRGTLFSISSPLIQPLNNPEVQCEAVQIAFEFNDNIDSAPAC